MAEAAGGGEGSSPCDGGARITTGPAPPRADQDQVTAELHHTPPDILDGFAGSCRVPLGAGIDPLANRRRARTPPSKRAGHGRAFPQPGPPRTAAAAQGTLTAERRKLCLPAQRTPACPAAAGPRGSGRTPSSASALGSISHRPEAWPSRPGHRLPGRPAVSPAPPQQRAWPRPVSQADRGTISTPERSSSATSSAVRNAVVLARLRGHGWRRRGPGPRAGPGWKPTRSPDRRTGRSPGGPPAGYGAIGLGIRGRSGESGRGEEAVGGQVQKAAVGGLFPDASSVALPPPRPRHWTGASRQALLQRCPVPPGSSAPGRPAGAETPAHDPDRSNAQRSVASLGLGRTRHRRLRLRANPVPSRSPRRRPGAATDC